MRSPDLTDVERIEGLLRGVPPESEREAQLDGLIRQLRAVPPAPAGVRSRVRSLREPEQRRFAWRPLVVALPLAAAMIGAAAFLAGGRPDGGGDEALRAPAAEALAPGATDRAEEFSQQGEAVPGEALSVAPTQLGARAQEWDVSMELRVPNNDRLSDANADAVRITRDLGGYVVSSTVGTQGRNGAAQLVVRVPSRRIQDAIARLSELGTITGQNISIQDRQADLDRLARQIDQLRVRLAEVNVELAKPGLSSVERVRLELRRERIRGQLNQLVGNRRTVSREVALADIALTIHTGKAVAAPAENRFEAAARDALHALAVVGAAAIFLLIVLSPLLALAVGAFFARRAYRRRVDDRLLDEPRPAATR